MLSRFKDFLVNKDNRPMLGILVFFLVGLLYFLFTIGVLSMPSFSGSTKNDENNEDVSPTPTVEPTPTDEPEEEPTRVPTKRVVLPTSTPKPTATHTPAPTSTPGPTATHTPAPTNTPVPSPTSVTPTEAPSPTQSDSQ